MKEIGIYHYMATYHYSKGTDHLHTEYMEDSEYNDHSPSYYLLGIHIFLDAFLHLYILASILPLIFIFHIHLDKHILHA